MPPANNLHDEHLDARSLAVRAGVGTRGYSALNREAITLAQQGVASIEDIDRAWMHVTKAPVGPLGALDAVGLDTVWTITDYCGDLGVKSGRGFYTYPDPAYAQPGFIDR